MKKRIAVGGVVVSALCNGVFAEPEVSTFSFVGTATGSGTLNDNTPWTFTGTSVSLGGKKSGNGSTSGGFAARLDPLWQAESSASFGYSIDADGIFVAAHLAVKGTFPWEYVQTWYLLAALSANITFTTDEPMFIADARAGDCGGYCTPLFELHSSAWYESVGLLFPGTHQLEIPARSIASTFDREIDRASNPSAKIKLRAMPGGFADPPGVLHPDFSAGEVYLSRDGKGAVISMSLSYSSPPYILNLGWAEDAKPNSFGVLNDTVMGVARSGAMIIAKSDVGTMVRWTQAGGRQEIAWPDSSYWAIWQLGPGNFMASEDGNTLVAGRGNYLNGRTVLWKSGSGFQTLPVYPGASAMTPIGIARDGNAVFGDWTRFDGAGDWQESGRYVWTAAQGFLNLPAGFDPAGITESGQIVLGGDDNSSLPQIFEGGVVKPLPVGAGETGRALWASTDGSVIVGLIADGVSYDIPVVWLDRTRHVRLRDYLSENRIPVDRFNDVQFRDISADGKTIAFTGWEYVNDSQGYHPVTRPMVVRIGALCSSDFNNDRLVDDADFVIFVSSYNEVFCPSSGSCWTDLNSDGVTDDADFSLFFAAYNALVCE